ncbi:unnamed protein product, partial [marine sediment metagenome]
TYTKPGLCALKTVIKYLLDEILELAGNVADDMKVRVIKMKHIHRAIRSDEELQTFLELVEN